MRFDQLTIKSQEAVQEAQRDARARGNAELSTDHLLLALLDPENGLVPRLVEQVGADPKPCVRTSRTTCRAARR